MITVKMSPADGVLDQARSLPQARKPDLDHRDLPSSPMTAPSGPPLLPSLLLKEAFCAVLSSRLLAGKQRGPGRLVGEAFQA